LPAYRRAKYRIFENQEHTDYAVLNYDDPDMRRQAQLLHAQVFFFSMQQKIKGSFLQGETLCIEKGNGTEKMCNVSDIRLSGKHNIKNILAASLAAKLILPTIDIRNAIRDFSGLRHRFERITEIRGVTYIDDSKSTTVDSTLNALEYFPHNNVILIAGGRDKGSDFSPLNDQLHKLKYLILLGEASGKIRDTLRNGNIPIMEVATMKEAVLSAKKVARNGETVLLSPMCASFDMYRDYAHRGEDFRKAVISNGTEALKTYR